MYRVFICIGFIFLGCSTKQIVKTLPLAEKVVEKAVNYNILISEQQKYWEVTFDYPAPIYEFEFSRKVNLFRTKNWTIITPHVGLKINGDKEVLYSINQAPFKRVTLRFKTFVNDLPKDYEFFQKYTDSSVIMYTGHLYGRETGTSESWVPVIKAKAFGENYVVLQGKRDKELKAWKDNAKQGTYIYFGKINPVESDNLMLVADPGLPAWILKKTKADLPKIFNLYSKRLGKKLDYKPVIYFSFVKSNLKGFKNSGGTLPGLIQLSVEGRQLYKVGAHYNKLFKFLAHEAAHMWNSEMFKNTQEGGDWMHEGGADAFAFRAMNEFNLISKKELKMFYNNALNKCLNKLGRLPLNKLGEHREFDAYYDCGSTLHFIVEASIQKHNPALDIFDFWKSLMAKAALTNNEYNEDTFYLTADEMSKNPDLINQLKLMVQKKQDNKMPFIKEIFAVIGVKYQVSGNKLIIR